MEIWLLYIGHLAVGNPIICLEAYNNATMLKQSFSCYAIYTNDVPYESWVQLKNFVSLFWWTRCEGIRSITYFSKFLPHTHTHTHTHINTNVFKLDHISYLFNSSLFLFPSIWHFWKWCACLHCLCVKWSPFTWLKPFNISLRRKIGRFTSTYFQPHGAQYSTLVCYYCCYFYVDKEL